jgi:hypothetical protein
MAQSNHERVGRALSLLKQGLQPFVERQMQAVYGGRWQYEAVQALRDQHIDDDGLHLDSQALLLIIWDQWQPVFRNVLGHAERALVSELRETRNEWAHQRPFSTDDAYRALDSIQRLLDAVSAAQEADEVKRQKQELLRQRFEEQARNETRKVSATSIEGRPGMGLRPWREVIMPHPDVASGRYESAEFAADLGQVARGLGAEEYRDPRAFYQRTYLTYGLRRLLIDALQRLDGSGGNPVVDLQTSFGGGKTHSLLALYHLFSEVPASDLVGIDAVLREAGVAKPPEAQRAVLVGYQLSPGMPRIKPDGCTVNTLWGELAWQLLGKDGFAMVAEADRQGVSPGSEVLRELFAAAAPCLILIDEWVVYARQLYHVSDLPGGSFDANLSFAQALTEAAKAAPRTLVVATIPASDAETGGEGGREAAEHRRYLGLKAGQPVPVTLNASAVVVKPEVAAAQFAAATTLTSTVSGASSTTPPVISERGGSMLPEPARPAPSPVEQPGHPTEPVAQAQRFHGSVKLNPRMMAGNAGTIMDEVVRHLTAIYGADVQVTLEIQATLPAVSDDIKRTIEENCRTLRFESFDFEEE